MKVILTSDVKPLGGRGLLVDVKDGYANNYLLRQQLAVVATPGAMKQLEQQQNAKKRKQAEEVANAQDVATQLEHRAGSTAELTRVEDERRARVDVRWRAGRHGRTAFGE